MDLIHSYDDQGSQSSSDAGDIKPLQINIDEPSTSYCSESAPPKMVSSFEPLERIPMDRLIIATQQIAAQKPSNQKKKLKQKQTSNDYNVWISETDKEIRMCLGSIQVLKKHTILESMDRLASKLSKGFDKISKPKIADILLQHIRIYLNIYKFLFKSFEKGKRYYKRFIRILAVYTDLELFASTRGAEYDKDIAERIALTYQTYLDHLDGSMAIDVLLNTRRLWKQFRGILVLLFEYFLGRKMAVELPDSLFMKNLIIFKKWLYIEEFPEDKNRVRQIFVRFVKPKKTICMNSIFKPYLPVDGEGFVTIDNPDDILDKEYSITALIKCIKKLEQQSEPRQSGNQKSDEVIVLTDDEKDDDDDDDSYSNQGESSATYSHHDEMSNDFDWYSASSQHEDQSVHSQTFVETVSLDSPQRARKKTSSFSSLDSCDLNMDTTTTLSTEQMDENAQLPDVAMQKPIHPNDLPSTSGMSFQRSETQNTEMNGDNISTLNDSVFDRLVKDINSTQVSIPSNGNNSADSKNIENGESSETVENIEIISSLGLCRIEELAAHSGKMDKLPVENNQKNGVMAHASDVPNSLTCPSNGESSMPHDNSSDVALETPSGVMNNHTDVKMPEEIESVKHCDNDINVISSASPLKNHEETLKNINEIVEDDLKNHEPTPSTSNVVQNNARAMVTREKIASPPSVFGVRDVEMESIKENGNDSDSAQDITPQDWVPAAESTTSIITETSLLSKSEQDVLFKDKDVPLLFTDLWSNGPISEDDQKPEEQKSTRSSSDSPLTFLQNGIDPSLRMKTYSRRFRRGFVETKTISTQTSSPPRCSSPVTTIDESCNSKKDRYLVTDQEDDELFLRDIFSTTDIPARPNASPRLRSPMFASPTPISSPPPVASTPVASSSFSSHPGMTTCSIVLTPLEAMPAYTASASTSSVFYSNVQSSANSTATESAEVVVKRKRGRPRKYPLPEPGTTPIVPKPPRAPRQPRKPKSPEETPEVPVFEKRVLRERKPKPVPEPPKVRPRSETKRKPRSQPKRMPLSEPKRMPRSEPKSNRRRRNTIKMTIDAIFKQDAPELRAVHARRISNMLGIPLDSPKLAKILKRIDYNKSFNMSANLSSANESSMLQTFKNRSNGQMNNTEPATRQDTPSTILARKTYIKPNLTFSSFKSALRRISYGARRLSFNSSMRQNRAKSIRKTQTQRYSRIDIFDTSRGKRGRKKGSKDTKPRKRRGQNASRKTEPNITAEQKNLPIKNYSIKNISMKNNTMNNYSMKNNPINNPIKSPIVEVSNQVNETIELVDLTKELAPFELEVSNEMEIPFTDRDNALSSTQNFYDDPDAVIIKEQIFAADDTETDITNEFTTDPESTVEEDIDDSHTRKSKRRRKRPKILDL